MAALAATPDIDLDALIDLSPITSERAVELYAQMALIREFESRVNSLFLQGRIPGTIHLSHGQEACAVGGCASLRPSDPVTITHRGHGQALAKGTSARSLMAELYARETGCCRGMGGSLHVGDWEVGALPGISIVGASIPISAGLAFAARHLGEDKVSLCFTGDGATTEGDAHEGYNLASLWQLPVVYVCENNLYAMSAASGSFVAGGSIARRAEAYGMPHATIDGNDVECVESHAAKFIAAARRGDGPALLECLTYRQLGHSKSDRRSYRTRDEEAEWAARDPIALHRKRLIRRSVLRSNDAR